MAVAFVLEAKFHKACAELGVSHSTANRAQFVAVHGEDVEAEIYVPCGY